MGYELDYEIISKSINNKDKLVLGFYHFNDSSCIEIKHCLLSTNQQIDLCYIVDGKRIISRKYEFFLYKKSIESFIEEMYDMLNLFSKNLIQLESDNEKSIYYQDYFRLIKYKKLFNNNTIFLKKINDYYFLSYSLDLSRKDKMITNTFFNERLEPIFVYSFAIEKNSFKELFLKSLDNFLQKEKYISQESVLNEIGSNEIYYKGTYNIKKAQKEIKEILLDII